MASILTRIRNAALTYPQVVAPRLAGTVVRAITSGGASGAPKAGGPARFHRGVGLSIGRPGQRYNPQLPESGRKNGILAAQAAAAPAAPTAPADRRIVDVAEED